MKQAGASFLVDFAFGALNRPENSHPCFIYYIFFVLVFIAKICPPTDENSFLFQLAGCRNVKRGRERERGDAELGPGRIQLQH